MSLAVRHCVSLVADIHVASLGALQFSFGVTLPPYSVIVDLIWLWISGHSTDGSGSSSAPSSENVSRLSSSVGGAASGGRTIPSARR